MIDIIQPMIKKFLPFAKKRMGFDAPPRLFLRGDDKNANDPLGKTAYYDPSEKSITLYISQRHPKDVMRSLSHELVHHAQNCRGEFDEVEAMGDGYAQNDKHLREMEREAYEVGNMCFRDWEDSIKSTIYFEHLQKGENKMSTKDWKNGELTTILSEAFGFKFTLDALNEAADKNTGMSGVKGDDDDDTYMGHFKKDEDEIEEGKKGGKDWHATGKKAGQKGAHDKDTDYSGHGERKGDESDTDKGATDYSGHGDRAGDESDTDKGDKDYTWRKGEKSKTHKGLNKEGATPKGHGPNTKAGKIDRSDIANKTPKGFVNEDSGEEEGEHYDDNRMSDDDHIKAIEHHLDALRHDRDYDDDHIHERSRKDSPDRVAGRDTAGRRVRPLEEEEIEEVSGVAPTAQKRRTPHKRTPVPEDDAETQKKAVAAEGKKRYTKAQVREALKRTIKVLKEQGKI